MQRGGIATSFIRGGYTIEQPTGVRTLLTVPPYLAHSADELLLPREFVPRQ